MIRKLLFLLIFLLLQKKHESARILGVIPTPSYSHQIVFRPIWKELTKRGHEVIVITTDPENDNTTNVREIDVSFAYELWTKNYSMVKVMEEAKYNPLKMYNHIIATTSEMCNEQLRHPEIQKLLQNETEHFDLVMAETTYPLIFGFSNRFKCPAIGLFSMDLPNTFHSIFGNPIHPAVYPDIMIPYEGKLTFWERLGSTLCNMLMQILLLLLSPKRQIQIMEEHFGKYGFSSVYAILGNVSMVFINVDPATYVRPLGPAFVTIGGGGVHLQPVKPLPQDLQDYLDSGKDGVIYFSLGTNVVGELIPLELRRTMLEALGELPYKVLWKFDITEISDIPENVKVVKWLPQQDILRHPNIKLFITQGGLQSMEEAIFCNIPLVGIPFIGEQDTNVKKMARRGFGIHLDKATLTKESFKEAILEVIYNPKYKQKTIEIAKLSRDQPMTGLEKAVWWTEYVIRHKGAPHLKNPIADLPFYQYYLLDVIGTFVGILLVVVYITYKLIVFIKNLLFRPTSSKIKQQ